MEGVIRWVTLIIFSLNQTTDLDEVCFERSESGDLKLEDLVHPPDPISKNLINFCFKVLHKDDIIINPADEGVVESACIIGKEILDYFIHILKMTLLSVGYIYKLFTGRVVLKLTNYKSAFLTIVMEQK